MEKIPNIRWKIFRIGSLPVAQITGECKNVEFENLLMKYVLIMIFSARAFSGRIIPIKPVCKSNEKFSASFTIAFKTNDDFEKFIDFICAGK